MEIYEKVEKIVDKTGVSYEDAKKALEESGGDILDAMIILEKQHKIGGEKTAFYSTGDAMADKPEDGPSDGPAEMTSRNTGSGSRREERKRERREGVENFKAEVKRILQLSIRNRFVVQRKGETLIAVPTLALIIMFIFIFWFTLILLIAGLFLGCRYSFEFKGKAADTVNDILGRAADTAETIKKDFSQDKDHE